MEYVSSKDAQNRFGAVLDAAQHNPVIIQKHKRNCAVMLSMKEFEVYRKAKARALHKLCEETSREAKEKGLTPERLEQLLCEGP